MSSFLSKAEPEISHIWHLPQEIKRPLIISDLHIPYHEIDAFNVALDHGFKRDCDAIYINGDLIDFAGISRWAKDPQKKRVMVELDMVNDFLSGLIRLGLPVFWKFGNHEERWNRYLLDNAPELSDIDAFQIRNVLDLDDKDIDIIGPRQRALFGSLIVIHGHEFGQSFFNPVNPARGLFLRAKTSALAGHNHQTSKHSESNLNGKQMSCFSTGCLCSLTPDYRPMAFTKWCWGAAIVDVDGKWFDVENFEIIDNRVVR
jgi:predicted phosphodiesterase